MTFLAQTNFETLGKPGARVHFSQFGEDCVLWELLQSHNHLDGGFYVDVGAHHPTEHSNTFLLRSQRGWRGVNIDADPDAIDLFRRECPDCHNIHAAISDEQRMVTLTRFGKAPGMNTIDATMADRSPHAVSGRLALNTRTLADVLASLGDIPPVTLLSVDVEGHDLPALRSLDWSRHMPFAICVETHGMDLARPGENEIFRFLTEKGYRFASHVWVTSIFFHPERSAWRPR